MIIRGFKITAWKLTESADLRFWELMDSKLTAGEPAWHLTRTSVCDNSCVASSV